MAYRRTERVVKRLNARRTAILGAAAASAAEGGLAAVQIAAVAERAGIAVGTLYRYFPSRADLVREVIEHVSAQEIDTIRRTGEAAPGPLSAIAAAIAALGRQISRGGRLDWALTSQSADADTESGRLIFRRAFAAELDRLIAEAVRASLLSEVPSPGLAGSAVLGLMIEGLLGRDSSDTDTYSASEHEAVQSLTLMALRALGVADARARGLVVQLATPAPGEAAPSAVNVRAASGPSSSAGSCA